jgi:hypothetical protein
MVAAGEVIDGYRVASIEPESAIMTGLGRTIEVALSGPAATVQRPEPRATRGRNAGNNNNAAAAERAAQMQQMQQQLGGLLGGGNLPAAALEMLSRFQAGGGIQGVNFQDGNVVVQGADGQTMRFNPDQGTMEVRRIQGGNTQVEGVRVPRPGGGE